MQARSDADSYLKFSALGHTFTWFSSYLSGCPLLASFVLFPHFINFCTINQMGLLKRFNPKCLPPLLSSSLDVLRYDQPS